MSSSIFHRSLQKTYPTVTSGHGVYLNTPTHQILDGSSGAAVSCLGHSHPEVAASIVAHVQNDTSFAHTSFFTSSPAEDLAQFLLSKSGDAFASVNFLSSGSEAVESALKIARQWHVYNGQPQRVNFIGREFSYHGNTLGALGVGSNPSRRGVFEPILGKVFHHVSRCCYEADGGDMSEEEYEYSLIKELEGKIEELGGDTVAAVIVEPVSGATMGAVMPTRTYLPRVRQVCDKYGILLIFDEVMCGMGRTGSYHAWQSLGGVAPDLQTIGKGLGGGYIPLSAVLMGRKVAQTFEAHSKGDARFVSGHTFQGHVLACASALTVQKIIQRDNLLQNVVMMGELLGNLLQASLSQELVSHGAHVRGKGLFRAVDFGRAGDAMGGALAGEVAEEAFRNGAAVYTCSPVFDAVLLAPPFIIKEHELKKLVDIFASSVRIVVGMRSEGLAHSG